MHRKKVPKRAKIEHVPRLTHAKMWQPKAKHRKKNVTKLGDVGLKLRGVSKGASATARHSKRVHPWLHSCAKVCKVKPFMLEIRCGACDAS